MTEELNPVAEEYELDPYHKEQDDFENSRYEASIQENAKDDIENSEMKKQGDQEPVDSRRETEKAVKGGPGDYSWGGYEDQKHGGIQKPANVSQEDW